jgi:hypothetical protein
MRMLSLIYKHVDIINAYVLFKTYASSMIFAFVKYKFVNTVFASESPSSHVQIVANVASIVDIQKSCAILFNVSLPD